MPRDAVSKKGKSERGSRNSLKSLTLPAITSAITLSPQKPGVRKESLVVVKPQAVAKFKALPLAQLKSRVYRYKVFPGNNSRVILSTLKLRSWWYGIIGGDGESLATSGPSLIWEMYRVAKRYKDKAYQNCLLNHLQHNNILTTKKGLYLTIKTFCEKQGLDAQQIIPKTFYLASGTSARSLGDDEMADFSKANTDLDQLLGPIDAVRPDGSKKDRSDVIWIMKPASRTNRGFGEDCYESFLSFFYFLFFLLLFFIFPSFVLFYCHASISPFPSFIPSSFLFPNPFPFCRHQRRQGYGCGARHREPHHH